MLSSSLLVRSVIVFSVALPLACTGGAGSQAPAERFVSDAALSQLPSIQVSDGMLICTAMGQGTCPLHASVANSLGKGRIALWEPGRQIMTLDKENPSGHPLGEYGEGTGKYVYAIAVGLFEGSIAVLDGQRAKLVRYGSNGSFEREDDIPRPDVNSAPGFVGSTPVLQSLRAQSDTGPAHLRLEVLRSQAESTGELVLDVPVPWLRLIRSASTPAASLFPVWPRYAVDNEDEAIVWTPGDSFWVQRRAFGGRVLWTVTSDRKGAAVTDDDIARRRAEIERSAPVGSLNAGDLDSMTAHTAKVHPVIGGFLIEPAGRVMVAGTTTPSHDSVEYVVLSRDGVPTHRMSLPSRTRPLYFGGDSLLVHRPTEGEPWEVRWLRLQNPR